MISITIHLLDTVLPKLPLRQRVLSVPKWLRFYIEKDADLASHILRVFIHEIEKQLKKSCDGITSDAKLGAVGFIQRIGSRLNHHLHYHCVVLDGLFYTDTKGIPQFSDIYNLGIEDTQAVVARVRKRVLSLFKRRNLLTEEQVENLTSWKGVGEAVSKLTAAAMGNSGISPELYDQRLKLTLPQQEQVLALGKTYYEHRVPDVAAVINILQRLNKTLYLISAGLHPAIAIFGTLLKIPASQIFTVDIKFDQQGHYLNYESTSPLTHHEGKREIALQLQGKHPSLAYVGDGINDVVAKDIVTRFVGYGGIFYRENIAKICEFYIKSKSIASLLPLLINPPRILTIICK
jgi:phosphoserine phosphatase